MFYLTFDTETTGLYKHPHAKMAVQPKIIEFGGALLDQDGNIVDELQLLINPGEPLEAIITKITGLTDEDLVDEPPFTEVYPLIRDFFARADAVIAHNLPFDYTLVNLELQRHELTDFRWPKIRICTVQENVPVWGRRPKLTELYARHIEQPLAQTHRAIDDVRALVEVIKKQGVLHVYNAAIAGSL